MVASDDTQNRWSLIISKIWCKK